jgi:hypothetical protein
LTFRSRDPRINILLRCAPNAPFAQQLFDAGVARGWRRRRFIGNLSCTG